jgi:hypothetical protein
MSNTSRIFLSTKIGDPESNVADEDDRVTETKARVLESRGQS